MNAFIHSFITLITVILILLILKVFVKFVRSLVLYPKTLTPKTLNPKYSSTLIIGLLKFSRSLVLNTRIIGMCILPLRRPSPGPPFTWPSGGVRIQLLLPPPLATSVWVKPWAREGI